MTNALPYLRSLRKPDLVSLAQTSNLEGWERYRKTDLEQVLDLHLSSNQSHLRHDPKLVPYFQRLSKVRSVKKEPATASPAVGRRVPATSATEITPTPVPRVRTPVHSASPSKPPVKLRAIREETASSPTPTVPSKRKQVSRLQLAVTPRELFPTKNFLGTPRKAYESFSAVGGSTLTKKAHRVRAFLSNMRTIRALILLVEACFLLSKITPVKRYPTSFDFQSPSRYVPSFRLPVIFVIPQTSKIFFGSTRRLFWLPLLLWMLVNLAVPTIAGYFINFGRTASRQSHPYSTTGGFTVVPHERHPAIDPFTFDATRMLIAYHVYGHGFGLYGYCSAAMIRVLSSPAPGCLKFAFTGGVVGILGSLYEGLLKK